MKIYVHLTGELKTAYKTLYIKWFQELLPNMSKYKIIDGKTAIDSDIIIVTINTYKTSYHNNSRFDMKKYILIDTQDSCSVDGIKFFNDGNIIYIIKPHLLNPISLNNKKLIRGRYHSNLLNELYKKVSPNSKDITCNNYDNNVLDKIKCLVPHWYRYIHLLNTNTKPLNKRSIDVCFLGTIKYHNKDGNMKNFTGHRLNGEIAGSLVTQHRLDCIEAIKKLKCNTKTSKSKMYYDEYISIVNDTKIFVSPYGHGEFSHKDFEVTLLGCILIKPLSNNMVSYPNIYEDGVTCISCKLDYSDLQEKVNYLLNNPKIMNKINDNIKKRIEIYNNNTHHTENFYNLLKPYINDYN